MAIFIEKHPVSDMIILVQKSYGSGGKGWRGLKNESQSHTMRRNEKGVYIAIFIKKSRPFVSKINFYSN